VFAGAKIRRGKKVVLLLTLAVLSLVLLQACGGDGSSTGGNTIGGSAGGANNGGNSGATSPGEYQVMVTGTSGSLQRTTLITLTVQ
jgi:ABC-type oligopeptide transport system substrate-binding subunit